MRLPLTASVLLAGLTFILLAGCQKRNILDPGGGGGDTLILTQANHPTGWNSLDCFTSGCHANEANYFDPFSSNHEIPEKACSSNDCHGNNGVMDASLLCGVVYEDDLASDYWAENVVVKAVLDGNDTPVSQSRSTDQYGRFTLSIPGISAGSFRFELARESVEVKSSDYSMELLEIDGSEGSAVSCSSCHGNAGSTTSKLNMNPS